MDAGGAVVEVLVDGASEAQLDAWIGEFGLEVTTVLDVAGATGDELQGREWTYVIDTANMQIVWEEFGSYDGSGTPSAASGLATLHRLLGQ